MKNRRISTFVLGLLAVTIPFLISMIFELYDYTKVTNYTSYVRGSTQKFIVEELQNIVANDLMQQIDIILHDLSTGQGEYQLAAHTDDAYQEQLIELNLLWSDIKSQIHIHRNNIDVNQELHALSDSHFLLASELVANSEATTYRTAIRFSISYCIIISVFILIAYMLQRYDQKKLKRDLAMDHLTGLFTRNSFEEMVEYHLRNHPQDPVTMIAVDINGFKGINDTYGFAVGDKLLRNVANTLLDLPNTVLLSARFDADHFVALCVQDDDLIATLHQKLTQSNHLEISEYFGGVRFTFGGYEIEKNSAEVRIMISNASTALKIAKRQEHELVVWYTQELLQTLERETYFADHMAQAMKDHEFIIFLQPQIDLKNLHIVNAEALVRWKLPSGELVFPDSFIPLFERNGMICELDFHMLERACQLLVEQKERGVPLFTIAVNFSRITLHRPDFAQKLLSTLNRYQLPYHSIEVEVVENAMNELDDSVLQMLYDLRDKGFHVAMDDFGAGYSSLSFLSVIPAKNLKLDRQFLWEIDRNDRMRVIIEFCVNMAHNMGMEVICEGVESQSHVTFLQSINCEYAQGYFFSKPVSVDAFLQDYTNQPHIAQAMER